jgi:hypothetical protein
MRHMKLMRHFFVLGILYAINIAGADPTFELWNKVADQLIYYKLEQNGKTVSGYALKKLEASKYEPVKIDISKPTTLFINYKDVTSKNHANWTEKIEFNRGKTIYVRLKKEKGKYIFGPQTGPLKGFKGVTERGYSLKNNVKESDYTRYEFIQQSEAEKKVAAYLALPTIQRQIQNGSLNKDNIIKTQAQNLTPYQILGIAPTATEKDITDAAAALNAELNKQTSKDNGLAALSQNTKIFAMQAIILNAKNAALAMLKKKKK